MSLTVTLDQVLQGPSKAGNSEDIKDKNSEKKVSGSNMLRNMDIETRRL